MPRLTNSVPKYRKHKASGQAIVQIAGKTYYLGPHGSKVSHAEYDRLVAEWLSTGRSPSFGRQPDELTVSELLVVYLRYAKAYYGKGSRGEYANMRLAAKRLRNLYRNTNAAEFGPVEFKAVRQTLVDAGQSRTYVNATMQRILRVFRWGAGEGLVPASVAQALSMIPGLRKGRSGVRETEPVQPVVEADVRATLPHLPKVVADMVRFQRLVGCRPAEVCMIRPCDVEMSGEVWQYRPNSHKTEHHGRKRLIFVGPRAQDVLRRYLLRSAESCCFSPQDSERKRLAELHASRKTPLSCGNVPGSNRKRRPRWRPRDRYDVPSYRQAIHRACDKAGIERWSPNRLRHSAATEIRSRFGLEAAQVVLGHASADTSQIYAERDLRLAARVAREVG